MKISGEFRFGGWQVPYNDEAIARAVLDLFSQPFELLLGRRSYDIWAAWPRIGADSPSHPIAGPLTCMYCKRFRRSPPVC